MSNLGGSNIPVYVVDGDTYKNTTGKSSRGAFTTIDGKRVIVINADKASLGTVYHEMMHGYIISANLSPKQLVSFVNSIKSELKKGNKTEKQLAANLEAFQEEYIKQEIYGKGLSLDDPNIAEEFVSEFVAQIKDNVNIEKMSISTIDKIRLAIAKILKEALGTSIDTAPITSKQEAFDFVNGFLDALEGRTKVTADTNVEEQGESGEVGTINIPKEQIEVINAPKLSEDKRSFVQKFVTEIKMTAMQGRKFVTNMYDYTNAGITNLGNGYSIELFGGRNYVPMMMERNGVELGDVSNLAAFNTKSNAEGFIRNAKEGKADLFAPHSGGLEGSWQFQHHIFESLVNLVLENKILSKSELIELFNTGLNTKGVSGGIKAFAKFNEENKTKLKNLNRFKKNPLELVELLNAENNYSPNLRKILNQKIASNKKFQKAIGVKNLNEFHNRISDPLNIGVSGGEIMTFVEFDPDTFKIVKTKTGELNHHPSFSWVVMAKIKAIHHPDKYYKSYDITESYTKYNTDKTVVEQKSEVTKKQFIESNVKSSAGAIPKIAEVDIKEQIDFKDAIDVDISNRFETDEKILSKIPTGKDLLYHGGIDISWTGSEDIDTISNTKNASSKYLFLAVKPETALNYSAPTVNGVTKIMPDSGVAVYRINKQSKVYNLKRSDIAEANTIQDLEKLYDSVKKRGFDIIKNTLDADNRIVLNNEVLSLESVHYNKNSIKEQIDWQSSELGKGKANPAIVNRTTPVQEAALELLQGKITNAEYQKIVSITQPIDPITQFFLPASTKDMQDALDSNKAKLLNTPLEDGAAVGLRLDIPAYKNWDIWVVSIHDSGKAGKSLSYSSVAWATDVTFGSNPKVAAFIAAGQNLDTLKKQDKTTIARMHGKWKNFEGKTKEDRDVSAVKKVEEIVKIENSFAGASRKGSPWRQVGMNPFRHSFFYDRRTGQPVIAASEVVQIGGLVYAKDVVYADKNDSIFEVSGYKDAKGEPVRFQLEDQVNEESLNEDAYSNFEENKDALFQSDLDAQVDADVSQEDAWKQRDRTLFERFVDLTRRKIQDKYRNIVIIQEDIEYATGKPVGLDQDFENAETLMHGKAKNELEKTDAKIQDIVSKIKKSGLSVDEVNDLLYAMHAQERNRYLRVISTDIGKSLMAMRKKKDMKPSEVAELLGISTQDYVDIEANKTALTASDLADVLLIYGTTPSRFFYDYALVKNGSGMTDVEAREILAKYDLDLTSPDVSQLSSRIRPVILAVRDLTADTRRRLVESGLESESTIDAFTSTYKNYVPLRGFADEEFSSDIIEGGRVLEVRARERKAKGRATRADSPLTQAISANTTTIIRAAKNKVLQKLYNLAKENPNKEVYEVIDPEKDPKLKVQRGDKIKLVAKTIADYIQDPKTVSVRIDGDYKFIKFTNEELAKKLTESSTGKANIITNLLGSFNRYLSKMITSYNPAFIFLNFTRDIQSAWLNALAEQDIEGGLIYGKKIANDVVKDVAEAVKVIYGVEGGITGKGLSRRFKDKASKEMLQYYKDFKEDGATTQWFYSKPISELKKDIDALMNPKTSFKDGLNAAAGTVERINLSFENASRLSAYANARRAGVSREKAAQLAKNITVNFNKSGEWSGALNSYFMFFNAAVQGGSRLFRSLKPRVIKDSDGNRSYHLSTVQKVALGQFLLGMSLSFLNEASSDDDEDGRSFYSKIPDYVKERNVVIMNPFNGKDYFTIPMPYGFNIFHSSGVSVMDGMQKLTSVGDVYNNIIQGFIGATVPINFPNSDSWNNFTMKMISPSALQWFTSLSLNENYFGQTIYNENFPGDPTPLPESELGRKSGRQATKAMTKWLNKITGGSEFRSGFIDLNPDKIDFMLEFLTGGAGKFTLRSYGVMEKIFSGNWDEIEARQVPFLRTFYGQPYKYTDISDFYDRYYLVNQMQEEVKAGIISGAEANRVSKVFYLGKNIRKQLSNLKKREDAVMQIKDADVQKDKMKNLEELRYKLVADYNKQYERFKIDNLK